MLRAFVAELILELPLREAGALFGRGHEQVRRFANGQINELQHETRKKLGELYLAYQREVKRVRESPATPSAGQLTMVLPGGRDAAVAEIRRLFRPLVQTDRPDFSAQMLEAWLIRRVEDESARKVTYRKRPRDDGA